jgi:glycerol uptake facilitator-like aquaporin
MERLCMYFQRLLAELLGSAFLTSAIIGAGIMAPFLTTDRALIMFANALAAGTLLMVNISILGPVSGGHFNPLVSLAFMLRRQLSVPDFVGYVLAQFTGAFLGVLITHAMFGMNLIAFSSQARSGTAHWVSEGVATFGLVFVFLTAYRHAPRSMGMLVGSYLAAAYWFTASGSFANPAVTLARAYTNTFTGIRLSDVPFFVGAELIGALCALVFAGLLLYKAPEQQTTS